MTDAAPARGFAASEPIQRQRKARKIERLLDRDFAGADLLDLGTGSGVLAAHFTQLGAHVVAADRDVSTFTQPDIRIVRVDGALPFADESFDVVLFNHVIEHVGPSADQAEALSEIARVLRPGGQLYLAVPNRWALVEPHYRLPLLGAMPRRWADALVRLSGENERYDCYPFALREIRDLLGRVFPRVEDRTADAFALFVRDELDGPASALLRRLPAPFVRAVRGAFPTLVLTATK